MDGINNALNRIQEIESSMNVAANSQMTPPSPDSPDFQKLMESLRPPDPPPGVQMGPNGQLLFNNPNIYGITAGTICGPVSGDQIAAAAAGRDGAQYWSNACAHAVNDVLSGLGINIKDKTNNNPNWVPNYANLGQKVPDVASLKPGDLVIYNNYLGEGGYDHIGIYAGNGEAWNVSTAAGHKWVKTPIGNRFQEGRRIATS
ncbi:MAG: NlpC/P60 family protein [Candidatus Xenobia bacterium]